LEGTWKEVLVACFKVLSQCLVEEEAQESHENRSADGCSNTEPHAQHAEY